MEKPTPGRYVLWGLLIVLAVVLIDQYTKWMVVETMLRTSGDPVTFKTWLLTEKKISFFENERESFKTLAVLPFLNLVVVWNQGISFGMFDTHAPTMALVLMSVALLISIILVIGLVFAHRASVAAALALIVGGALGNVLDRLRFGAVADFVDVHAGALHWPAFNIADSCIVAGAALLVLDSFLSKEKQVLID